MTILWKLGIVLVCLTAALPLAAREKDAVQYGTGLIVNVPFPESAVVQVIQDVIQSGIIRGSKEYNKDEYITGAVAANSTRAFPEWTEGGQVFYKVRLKALNPRNFKDSNDVGTLAVRYVVQGQGDKNTVLRINAVFTEDFRHISHPSDGSVESAEYKDIHDRLDAIDLMNAQAIEKQRPSSKEAVPAPGQGVAASELEMVPANATVADTPATDVAQPPAQTLEEHVKDLRRQVERRVKAPGAALKSAPFHTASTLQSLPAGADVLIVISTPYWLGVETHEGQHGWMLRDELELLP